MEAIGAANKAKFHKKSIFNAQAVLDSAGGGKKRCTRLSGACRCR